MLELKITIESGKTYCFSRCSGPMSDKQGRYVKIGSFDANYWFCVAFGKTEKLTLSYALTHLHNVLDIIKHEYI